MASGKFKITRVAHIQFLLASAALEHSILKREAHSERPALQ